MRNPPPTPKMPVSRPTPEATTTVSQRLVSRVPTGSGPDPLRHMANAAPTITRAKPAMSAVSGMCGAMRVPARVPATPRIQNSRAWRNRT